MHTFSQFGYDPATGEWNDSLLGNFLWSNVNTSEALPVVMTPATWFLWQYYYVDTNPVKLPAKYPFCGNIAGRAYLNLSLVISLYRSVGKDIRRELHADIIGSVQSIADIPLIPFPPLAAVWMVLPGMLRAKRFVGRDSSRLREFIHSNLAWCRDGVTRVKMFATRPELLSYWQEELKPRFFESCWYLRSVTMQFTEPFTNLRLGLQKLDGIDAAALQTGLTDDSNDLESIGPLLGLSQVARGKLDRQTYVERYGHRGPYELELFAPGAEEDPDWLDKRLDDFLHSPIKAELLLEAQQARTREAWQTLQRLFPEKVSHLRRRFELVAEAARNREAVRSEITRLTRLIRAFLLRVGELTGLDDGIFFLSLGEMEAMLADEMAPLELIPMRRDAYTRYSALPPYPPVIIGRFDPFLWAADPNRRNDCFDARRTGVSSVSSAIKGFPGAGGVVEGIVRRMDRAEDGDQLQVGEVLVAVTTNVGWTPLFPRLAAVVTDVGAPLSHAAIVARELGIPAVVGCGNATSLLRTGDRVRVDGGRGVVEVLERGNR